jgi:hypothetical protein
VIERKIAAAFAPALLALAIACAPGPAIAAPAAGGDGVPFVVKVMTENDNGIGAMTYRDMAKLVYLMFASGAPAGAYKDAVAAGMKTVWYQDPHRVGDVPGKMSDRPPITALNKQSDIMRCAGGGFLNATYSPNNGTYFGDPTSANLLHQTNAQLAAATAHYGPISYLWLDDSMLITDMWADVWHCGNSPPALTANAGNGMPMLGHGQLRPEQISFANGTPYTPRAFLAALVRFDDGANAPVLDEGSCVGDGRGLDRDASDGGATVELTAAAKNSAGTLCENFAEGWGNRQTLNGKAVDDFWLQDLNSGIRTISAHKLFISYAYVGNENAANFGTVSDYDQRGYVYASFMLLFDERYSVYKTGLWGARLGVTAPVLVLPENLLVPQQPLTTALWPERIGRLKKDGVYVREFASCGYAGRSIGPCAALVNPSSTNSVPLPPLAQRYTHAIAFTGNNGAFTGRHGTPNYGDTGDVTFNANPVPGSLPPAGWAILVR